ncbi:MAG: hypothetical protein HN368_13940 [Spirochaetales bacterium]|jgi:hypothetical protein|nr:hypothetical protein [Spirochaetales bacterium]
MKNIPINEAETILEPFWDGGSSEHPTDKMSLLDAYSISKTDGVVASIEQVWCALQVRFDSGEPGSLISMSRNCKIDITGYDIFRIFASIPSCVELTVRATIDGLDIPVIEKQAGVDTNDEFDGNLRGSKLTSLSVEYRLCESRAVNFQVLWFGLANRGLQQKMESRKSPYSPDWEGYLKYPDKKEIEKDNFTPHIGILMDSEETELLRTALRTGSLAESYQKLLGEVQEYLNWEPERDIGKYIPKPDRRWVRNRDVSKTATAGIMEVLAFTGLIEQNYEMTRMACRMALSVSHCEYWSESIVGSMPGTTWHHRSFTEEVYSRACGLVLDWAGFALTDHAKQLIRDAIIMKGLPRIESDFKRMEYIRYMNQGIVFSSGRIFGTLALLDAHPRYSSVIDEAERDLHEMIDNYVHSDGGTLEGMGYWSYTFSSVMPAIFALARYRGKSMVEYATDSLRATGNYGLGMLSTLGDGDTYLPVNDAHAGMRYPLGLLAAYAVLSGEPEWQKLYELALEGSSEAPDIYHLIMSPRDGASSPWDGASSPWDGASSPRDYASSLDADLKRGRYTFFQETGQLSSVRKLRDGDSVLLHICSGPTDGGHYHEDKGSIIIEAGGEPLAFDRGITDYHHPETSLMGMASRHNLVYPVSPDGRIIRQPRDSAGGKLTSSVRTDDILLACSDNRDAWETGVFSENYRRLFSPLPNLILIDDELTMPHPAGVHFRINTSLPVSARESEAEVQGQRYHLRVVPMNWIPATTHTGTDGVDSHLELTNIIEFRADPADTHRFITLLEIYPADSESVWASAVDGPLTLNGPEGVIAVDADEPGSLGVSFRKKSGEFKKFVCDAGTWSSEGSTSED